MRFSILLLALAITAMLSGCAEDTTTPTPSKSPSISGVYFYDDGEQFRFIEIPRSGGNAVLRGRMDKDYSFAAMANERNCAFKAVLLSSRPSNVRWLQLANEEVFLQTATQGAGGEVFLSYDETEQPDLDDETCLFRIHELGSLDGLAVVAVESLAHPGYYFTTEGNIMTANGITLRQYAKPEDAPRWRIHSNLPDFGLGI
jgi:hypothetical protein